MILLIGEFSGVHLELAKSLRKLNYEITTVSDGDSYKSISSDILVEQAVYTGICKWLNLVVNWLGFNGALKYRKLVKKLDALPNIELVQIINPVAIDTLGGVGNLLLLLYLRRRTKNIYLCSLGDDYRWVEACLRGRFIYSPMDRLLSNGIVGFLRYQYTLKHIFSPVYIFLNFFARWSARKVIPGLLDYKIAYEGCSKLAPLIPLPVSEDRFHSPVKSTYPLIIFHGWQTTKDNKKGGDILDLAARKCVESVGEDKVIYKIVSGVPYDQYIQTFNDADIFLDQVFSYDRGMNGALGMAAGKVVFSGFEQESLDIGVNATPDAELLAQKLISLVNDIDTVNSIRKAGFEFASRYYSSDRVVQQYLSVWGMQRADPENSG
tara:strand:+ start:128 stop:1264 length:1137 start_codon:yes stop_codon:yes gene_type:complete